jgi:hypothetical protein
MQGFVFEKVFANSFYNPSNIVVLRNRMTLVESEALVRAFSPGSSLESGLKVFRRRGPKWLL